MTELKSKATDRDRPSPNFVMARLRHICADAASCWGSCMVANKFGNEYSEQHRGWSLVSWRCGNLGPPDPRSVDPPKGCTSGGNSPLYGREVGGGRIRRQPGQVRKEAAL